MTIENIEALERAATAGPWNVQQAVGDGNRYHVVSAEIGKPPFDWLSSFNTYGCPITKENADLIAAARNALPQLLAVAKAAKEMVADLDRWEQAVAKVVDYKFVPKWNSKEATRAALAQLEAKP